MFQTSSEGALAFSELAGQEGDPVVDAEGQMGVNSREAACVCSGDALRSNCGAKALRGGASCGNA